MRRDDGPPALADLARRELGFSKLRPGQAEATTAVLDGRDTLVVMPTGSGKSAVYELATLIGDGRRSVVVSPLLALQRDQVESLELHGASAAEINSTVGDGKRDETFARFKQRDLQFLFLAPEQFAREETIDRVAAAAPELFVVDEAHCISDWGHDFRPDYLRLGAVAEAIGRPTILALTATASPPVRDEIVARLRMRDPVLVVRGFDRPNIALAVTTHQHEEQKLEAVVEATVAAPKPGIVYSATRRGADELAHRLAERGVSARAYHAGMNGGERDAVQTAFMDDQLDVIVATVAFGMGVDKPNVRFVFHSEISDSVDSYYQEIGRAGRDGGDAEAVLFYRPQDVGLRRFFASGGHIDAEEVASVADAVGDEQSDPESLEDATGLSGTKVTTAVTRLEDVGAIEVLPSGEVRSTGAPVDAEEAAAGQERRRAFDRSRVEMIRGYAELDGACRREYLLNYFGEPYRPPCGNCDNCRAGIADADSDGRPFALRMRVVHASWGEGSVQRYEGDKMVVLFDGAGYKTLDVNLVKENRLLEPATTMGTP